MKTCHNHKIKNVLNIGEKIKSYTDYLIAQYILINDNYLESSVYWDLKNLSEFGTIKDLIFVNTKSSIKIEIIKMFAKDIKNFAFDFNKKVNITDFDNYGK